MIFVTVGTDTHPFNRLLIEIDRLIEEGKIKEEVIAQIGYSTYIPKNYEYFRFTSFKRILDLIKRARLIISHAGVGNVIMALTYNKPLIVVPRRKEYNEHTDNHQIQIAKELEKRKKVIAVYNMEDLEEAIKKSKNFAFKPLRKKSIITSKIDKFLKVLSRKIDKNEN
jgi:UDP-N-acetylglucosamine transferase subunit ALG13